MGSGIPRIIESYNGKTARPPFFEEAGTFFNVTLYGIEDTAEIDWADELIVTINKLGSLNSRQIAKLWNVTDRTARNRLNTLIDRGLILRQGKSLTDPHTKYTLNR